MKPTFKLWLGLLFLLWLLLIILGFCSCKPVEKYKASPDFAKDCAALYPPIYVTGKPDTVTIPPVYIDCDSVFGSIGKTTVHDTIFAIERQTVRVPCPPSRIINQVDTFINTAAIDAIEKAMKAQATNLTKTILEQDLIIAKQAQKINKVTSQRNWLFGIIVAFIAGFVFNQYRKWKRLGK